LNIFFEASLYLLKKLKWCLCSVVNKDIDLLEHEHEQEEHEHEDEDLSEYIVFSGLFNDLSSGLFNDLFNRSSLIDK
jgi:hypothetical protein